MATFQSPRSPLKWAKAYLLISFYYLCINASLVLASQTGVFLKEPLDPICHEPFIHQNSFHLSISALIFGTFSHSLVFQRLIYLTILLAQGRETLHKRVIWLAEIKPQKHSKF